MYQVTNKTLPHTLLNMFTMNNDVHNHLTRNRNDPRTRLRRTAKAEQSIIYKGPKLWCNLPPDLKQCKTLHCLSRALKKQLIGLY